MKNLKRLKSVLLTTSLTLSISLFVPVTASAATYTAVRGDSLYKISQVFNTTTSNLMNDNNLTTTTLNIGQVLNVPCQTYTVQKGDTLFLISQRFKIALAALRRANNTYTDYIDVGQKLNIPAASTLNSTATSTTTPTVIPKAAPTSTPTVTPKASPASTPTATTTSETTYSASDLDLLSRLIMAEAQGESYDAKVAVGAIVINRVKSGLFADSISSVIYQNINGYYQFTPVVNGWINKPADSDSIKAAKAALSGVDPTNGALFYYDDSTTNTWLLAKQVSIKIDNMIYAY